MLIAGTQSKERPVKTEKAIEGFTEEVNPEQSL